ncbi:MAG: hypothetical protein ACI9FB_002187 [Candidatus Azotimanducaceae bacterium]|jgi:hypothetical protein
MSRQLIKKALLVAAVVGSVLLLINQFDALFGKAEFRTIPAILTYIVPFLVFMAGQLSNKDQDTG